MIVLGNWLVGIHSGRRTHRDQFRALKLTAVLDEVDAEGITFKVRDGHRPLWMGLRWRDEGEVGIVARP